MLRKLKRNKFPIGFNEYMTYKEQAFLERAFWVDVPLTFTSHGR